MTIETRSGPTAEDVLELRAQTGARYEIVEGRLKEMPPTGAEHGGTEVVAGFLLYRFVLDHPLGRVFVGEVLCRLQRNPKTARAADVGFIRIEQLPEGRLPAGPIEGAPNLVVEIISLGDTASEVQERIAEWLDGGASVVWTLYPNNHSVVIWRQTGASPVLRGADPIDAEPALPGFRCRAEDLFVG